MFSSSCDNSGTVAVAIVNYNTRDHLRACLSSVLADTRGEVVVADNASSDGSAEMVRSDFPSVALYANQTNRGYGAAANQAIASCRAPYVLLLNSDTRLAPGTLLRLSEYLDQHPAAAIVGPRLVHSDGKLQASCYPFPTPLNVFLEQSSLDRLLGRVPLLRGLSLRTWPHTRPRVVPYVVGAALAIRRAAFEQVGGFDESIFMYSEEADLSYRLAQAGWQTHFAPVATVVHVEAASTAQRRAEMLYRLYVSNMRFYQRCNSGASLAALVLIVKGSMLAKLIRDSLRLLLTREPQARARVAENIGVWQRVLTSVVGIRA
jgi:N-acetylglucosaminyl-diphospho-decaprenol L-rhamnosyltransferase